MKTLKERYRELKEDTVGVFDKLLEEKDKYDIALDVFNRLDNAGDILEAYKNKNFEYLAYEADVLYGLPMIEYMNNYYQEDTASVLSISKDGILVINEDLDIFLISFSDITNIGYSIRLIEAMIAL